MGVIPNPEDAEFVKRVGPEPRTVHGGAGRHRARRNAMMVLYNSDLLRRSTYDAIVKSIEAELNGLFLAFSLAS